MPEEVVTGSVGNSVDELNRRYREEAEKAAKHAEPEVNAVDEENRKAQGGGDTATAQTEAQEASLDPEGGLEEVK